MSPFEAHDQYAGPGSLISSALPPRPAQPKPIRVSGSNLFICSADEDAQEQRQREQNAKPRMKPGPKPGGPAAQSPNVPRGAAHAKPQMTPRTRALCVALAAAAAPASPRRAHPQFTRALGARASAPLGCAGTRSESRSAKISPRSTTP